MIGGTLKTQGVLVSLALLVTPAQAFDTHATAAYVVDTTANAVLLEKNADEPLPPASMSKLMTLNMLFEALQDDRVDMDMRFSVSERAKAMGGSTMFLNTRDRPTVRELIQGIVVQSGNDACVVVAEGLAGSEEEFARMMNIRASDLGMTNSTFVNSSGWPHPDHRMSMRDLALLATRLITEFPEFYDFFAQEEFGFDGRAPENRRNRNPLLSLDIGVDGLKTGHTQDAGYSLAGSAAQDGRRIVFVVTGLESESERREESERIVNWAFRQFSLRKVLSAGEQTSTARVWMGTEAEVGLVAPRDYEVLVPVLKRGGIEGEIRHTSPIQAPIIEGQIIGEIVLTSDGLPETRLPLVADRDVPHGGFLTRTRAAATILAGRAARKLTSLFR